MSVAEMNVVFLTTIKRAQTARKNRAKLEIFTVGPDLQSNRKLWVKVTVTPLK
jgi:hypothetical protein